MRHRLLVCLLFVVLAAGTAEAARGQEWTRFRGPNGAGQSDATTIPRAPTAEDFAWKIPLPGVGHASPVLWGEKLFLTSGDPLTGDQIVSCLDAKSGELIWRKRLGSSPHLLHMRNSFASSTPCVDERHLYVAWADPARYQLVAMDHDGQIKWSYDLGPFNSQHGFGISPIVYQDLVIIGNDQLGNGYLLAVDRMTGERKWRIPRTNPGKTAYSTPCVRTTADGREELIFESGEVGLTGVDPTTGAVNWSTQFFDKRTVSSPILAGDLIIAACGAGEGGNFLVGVRPPAGRNENAELVYRISDAAPYVPTSVVAGDLAFLWWDEGAVTCIDVEDGKIHWRSRAPGTYSGSPVRVGDRIYCINQQGDLMVVAATAERFELIAQIPLGEPSQATPAVAGGRMYLRTEGSIICLGGEG